MQIFDEASIRATLTPADALDAVERAFAALARGTARLPDAVGLHLPEASGEVHVKGAHIEGSPVFAFKVAGGFYRNPEVGLPVGSGLSLVFHAGNGVPLALLRDNGWLTELRTGAAGALAAKHLTPDRPLVVAMIGAGAQARFQARALIGVRRVAELRAWSREPESVRTYLDEIGPDLNGATLRAADSPGDAVRGADLVLTVTPAREPLVLDDQVGPGATVIAIGSDGPGKRELSTALVAGADKVVVDRLDQSVRLGELEAPVAEGAMRPEDVYAELGELVIGTKPGREGEDERIVCDLTGVGVQDVVVAELAWERLAEAFAGF